MDIMDLNVDECQQQRHGLVSSEVLFRFQGLK
jgi:hypothetical protein